MALRKTVLFSSPSGPPTWRIRYAPTTGYVWHFKKQSCFRPLRGCLHGVSNTPLQLDTCDPSKYRCKSSIGYVWLFEKQSRFRPLRARAVGRIQYAPTIGYVRFFEIPMRSPDWVRARVQKMDLYTPPSVAYGGAYSIRAYDQIRVILQNTDVIPQPSTYEGSKNGSVDATVGGVWWAYSIRPYNRVRAIFRNTDAIFQLGTCGSSNNSPVFVPFGAICGAYAIRPYGWVYVILRNTGAIFQLNMCGPSKNCLVFVPFGAVCGAYAIRPYDRLRATLRNTDAISQPSTYEGSKNGSVYATVGGVWWGVFDTPLQLDTCDPSKYRCNFPTGYVQFFEIPMQFPNRACIALQKNLPFSFPTEPSVGCMRYASTTGYVRSFEILMQFPNRVRMRDQKTVLFSSPPRSRGGAYSIRLYDRIRVILRNTDAISQPSTYGPSKNCLIFVPFGAVCGAYSIRPYNRVRATLRNTDTIS